MNRLIYRAMDPHQAPAKGDNFGCVYMLEDAAGDIIYVGQTQSWRERRWGHAHSKAWWPDVEIAHCLIHVHDGSVDEMLRIQVRYSQTELALIRRWQPKYNVKSTARDPRTMAAAARRTQAATCPTTGGQEQVAAL